MVQEPERRVDHVTGARGDLGAATKAGEMVADVAVVLLDREGQILAGEELLRRNQPVKAFPVVGQEDTALDATCRRLLDKVGIEGRIFLTDDWEGFHRLIPAEQLFTGKDLTFPIEQDNSNIRHYLARFRRRSKVTSRARHMVDSSLRLLHHLMQPENFLLHRDQFLSIFA